MDPEEWMQLENKIAPLVEKYCCESCTGRSRNCSDLSAHEVAAEIIELLDKEGRLKNDNGN